MQEYEKLEVEVIRFDADDIISTSAGTTTEDDDLTKGRSMFNLF